jgi:SAM-dependent methyltransferase
MIDKEFNPSLFHPYYFIRKGLLRSIQDHAGHLKGRLMDFGCGSKPYKSLFNVEEYLGVDFVNEGHPHDNEQIDVYYDGVRLPFDDNTFDSVLCSEVFEHIFNLPEIIDELNRVLKKDGKILITCPFLWKEHELPHDFARYTLFALENMLQKRGFKVIVKSKSGHFIEVIYQLMTLFFYDTFYPKVARIPIAREIFKFIFMFGINLSGRIASAILPKRNQLYFNNVIVAAKC